jgi:hypothetical protein
MYLDVQCTLLNSHIITTGHTLTSDYFTSNMATIMSKPVGRTGYGMMSKYPHFYYTRSLIVT